MGVRNREPLQKKSVPNEGRTDHVSCILAALGHRATPEGRRALVVRREDVRKALEMSLEERARGCAVARWYRQATDTVLRLGRRLDKLVGQDFPAWVERNFPDQ